MNRSLLATLALTVLGATVAVRVVRRLAVRRALFDHPNERSSHSVPVPRLGGAAFVPVSALGILFAIPFSSVPADLAAATALVVAVLYFLGFGDDVRQLSARLRLGLQVIVVAGFLVFLEIGGGNPMRPTSVILIVTLTLGIVGVVNIYNFMDGIDGIAGIMAVVGGGTWYLLAVACGAPWSAAVSAGVAAGAAGFLTLNWAPAKIFMGDAGSTVLGFVFAALPILVWRETGGRTGLEMLLATGVVVLWPFLADGVFTLVRRFFRRENIFQPHRSHLYQRLVIAGRSHACVTSVYGGVAFVGSLIGVATFRGDGFWLLATAYTIVAFGGLWAWTMLSEAAMPRSSK